MTPLSAQVRESLVREAARAPSVHNVQPSRWRFGPDGEVVLLRERGRELPVADPTGHDLLASLGASWEGMSIALSRLGLALKNPQFAPAPPGGSGHAMPGASADAAGRRLEVVARGRIEGGAPIDSLAEQVHLRRSFRGRFDPPTPGTVAALSTVAGDDALVVTERAAIARIAALHDAATWKFEVRPACHAELWSWLRLDREDPRWSRDGLNADCLALTELERVAARVMLRPASFTLLANLGVAKAMISEAPQVRSASGIVLVAPPRSMSAFDVGRRFYRLWLEIARAGLYAAPMSASADDPATRAILEQSHGVPAERRVANVLRVGAVDAGRVAESPRLPAGELMG